MFDTTLDYLMSNPGGLQAEVTKMIKKELGIPEHHELLGIQKVEETSTTKAFRKLIANAIEPLHNKVESSINENKESKSETDDDAMPVKRAANLLNLAVQTIYGMTSRREIPFYKKGKRIYFKKSELLEWIEEGKRKSRVEIARGADNYINKKK